MEKEFLFNSYYAISVTVRYTATLLLHTGQPQSKLPKVCVGRYVQAASSRRCQRKRTNVKREQSPVHGEEDRGIENSLNRSLSTIWKTNLKQQLNALH
ncbi:hypothetical protein M3J09_001491 [Ascochyta lentis]